LGFHANNKKLTGRAFLATTTSLSLVSNSKSIFIAPAATGTAPKGLESTGDTIMNLPWTHCGLPTLNLPSGKDETGLPFGLQLIGKWHEDEAMLVWATEIEKLTGFGGSQLY